MTVPDHVLRSERLPIVKALGGATKPAYVVALSARSFLEFLTERGIDPADYPERLTRTGRGGRPPRETPRNAVLRRRYRALRLLGVSSREATAASKSSVRFARARADAFARKAAP